MVETLSFTSRELEDMEAFRTYHDLYAGGSTCGHLDGTFYAEVTAFRYPRMLVFDRTLAGVSHERDRRRVTQDGFNHITLQLVRSGSLLVSIESVVTVVQPGQIIVFDMTRPQKTWTEGAKTITLSIGRDALAKKLSPFVDLHGRILNTTTCGLLADLMISLVTRGKDLNHRFASIATDTIIAFFAAALDDDDGRTTPTRLMEATKIDQALTFIDRSLSDPRLSADRIAASVGVSRSVLYRLFEPLGGVANCVQQRRLNAVRLALSRIDEARPYKTVAESYGFVSASHANRIFRQAFGMTPGEFRKELLTQTKVQSSRVKLEEGLVDWHLAEGLVAWHSEVI